jgi:hypothetical protein
MAATDAMTSGRVQQAKQHLPTSRDAQLEGKLKALAHSQGEAHSKTREAVWSSSIRSSVSLGPELSWQDTEVKGSRDAQFSNRGALCGET